MDLSAYRAIQKKNLTDEQMKRDLEYADKIDKLGLKAPNKIPVANQSQSNNIPSVQKQTGNALNISKQVIAKQQPTRQMGIGFNNTVTKPQPLPYANKVPSTLPRVDAQILQKAKQIAQQDRNSGAMYQAAAIKSGLSQAVEDVKDAARAKIIEETVKRGNDQKNKFVKLFDGISSDKGIRDNLAQMGANLSTNFWAINDRLPGPQLMRWVIDNFAITDDMAQRAGFANEEEMVQAIINRAMQSSKQNTEIQEDLARRSEDRNGIEKAAATVGQGVARILPTIGANMIVPGSGKILMGTQSYGGTMEGLREGTTLKDAQNRGSLRAAVEVGSEGIFDGIPGMGGLIKAGGFWGRVGEGGEEILSTAMDAPIRHATGDSNAQDATLRDYGRDFLTGVAVSEALNLPRDIADGFGRIKASKPIENKPQGVYNNTGKYLADLDIATASWNEINNSPDIQKARERAKFDTPTIDDNSPERQQLRQQIANELYALGSFSGKVNGEEVFNGPVKQERKAFIVIGPPAAGKSSVFANSLSKDYAARIIDSDMAKAKLPEFDDGYGASRVHMESDLIASTMLYEQAVLNGDNILLPLVGKNSKKIRNLAEALKSEGYTVELYLNELPADKAARRSVTRFMQTGRLVDPEYVLSIGDKPTKTYEELKQEGVFDRYVRKSNDVAFGEQPILIEDTGYRSEQVQTSGMGRLDGGFTAGNNAENKAKTGTAATNNQVTDTKPGAGFSLPQVAAETPVQPLFREPLKKLRSYDFEEASQHKDDEVWGESVSALLDQVSREKRKTFDQWIAVAKQFGKAAARDGVDITNTVYATWDALHPNRPDRLNRQGKGFVAFDIVDWQNAIVDGALQENPSLGERMRWNEEEGRYEDFESFWWGNPNMTEQEARRAFNSNEKYGTNTVGAAQPIPGSYANLQTEHGVVDPGENPARMIDMPVKDAQGRTNSLFARTVAESESMPTEMVPEWEKAVASGEFSHDIATDKAANRHAERELGKGWDYAMRQWQAVSEGNKIATKNDLALGQLLLANAMKDGDTQTAMKLAAELCAEATRAGQAVQSFRLLKKMTPEGMLYYLQKTVNNLNSDFEGRKGFEGIKIDEGMAERLGKATTREEMNAIVDEIKQDIAAQTPVTWYDKWNAWRYLSMLGNPTTQVRNVLGNALFVPAVKAKNLIATGIEAAWKKTGHLPYATKAVLTAKDKGLVDFADKDFANVVQEIQGGGKYSDKDDVLGKRQIFKNRFLEGWRNLTNTVMDKGDEIFSRQHYKASLAQYMKANKLNPDSITPEQLNKARSYAVQEAQRATYRDASSVASLINRTKRNFADTANNKDNDFGKRAAARAGEVLLEGFVPFTKTPVNIVKRGIEYSPIGLAQGTINLVRSVKNGEVDAAAAIDRMAAGLTGSGLLALGAWLASLGLVSGGPGEDDREEKYKGMLGEQDYALKLGDTTYTIDWMAPEALPFFTGVELYKELQSKDGITLADAVGLISAMSDPIVELSMLSSMNSTFESIKYSQGDALSTVVGNLITSYLGQGVPTIGGKIARTIDETSRQTYYDPNKTGVVKSADVFRQKVQAKIPFAANALPERVDLWGRTEKNAGGNGVGRFFYNMLSPGYAESKNVTRVDNELLRLAEATGDSNVYPDTADKTFKVDGESVKLDSKQYTQFAKTKGQTAFDILEAAVDSSTYKKMTDAEKADFVKDVYEYANAKAKAEVSSYQLDGKNAKIAQAEKKGIKPAQYLSISGSYDKDGNGSVTQDEVEAVLDKTNLTQAQKAYLWKLQNKSWADKNNPYK